MLPNKFEMPLDLVVRKSRIFSFYFTIVFILAVISLFISSLAFILKLSLFFMLVLFAVYILKSYQRLAITRLWLSSDGKWKIEVNRTAVLEAELEGECIVTNFLVWLNFKSDECFAAKHHFHLLLFPDAVDNNVFRRLKIRLRFLKHHTEQETEEVS